MFEDEGKRKKEMGGWRSSRKRGRKKKREREGGSEMFEDDGRRKREIFQEDLGRAGEKDTKEGIDQR